MGEDAVPEAWRRYGLIGLLRLLADIAVRLPAEYLGEIRQDVVYAVRVLARSPGFAAVAILSLALGIAMCSVILCGSSSVLRPMPGARDPSALFAARKGVSYPYFEHYRDQKQVAGAATVFLASIPFAVAVAGGNNARAERFYGHLVSPEYFSTLGVTPAAGRFFAPETEKPGMPPVVVVTGRFWRTYLNSDPHAIGRAVRLNGQLATIVGIAPEDFLGMWPFNPADLFVPLTCGPALAPELAGDPLHARDLEMLRMVLRLPHRVSIPAAETALDAMTLALDRQAPDPDRDRDPKSRLLRLMPAGTFGLTTPEQRAFVYAFNVVMWVLILSLLCANLANLLLARGSQAAARDRTPSFGGRQPGTPRPPVPHREHPAVARRRGRRPRRGLLDLPHDVRPAIALDGAVERRLSPRFPHFRAHPGGFVGDRDCLRPRAGAGRRARRSLARCEGRQPVHAMRLPALQPAQPLRGRPGGRCPHAAAGHRLHRHRLREH